MPPAGARPPALEDYFERSSRRRHLPIRSMVPLQPADPFAGVGGAPPPPAPAQVTSGPDALCQRSSPRGPLKAEAAAVGMPRCPRQTGGCRAQHGGCCLCALLGMEAPPSTPLPATSAGAASLPATNWALTQVARKVNASGDFQMRSSVKSAPAIVSAQVARAYRQRRDRPHQQSVLRADRA